MSEEERAEMEWMQARIAYLEERERKLMRALRAIDVRVHNDIEGEPERLSGGNPGDGFYYVPTSTLRQICNVAVALGSAEPEDA